MVSADDDSPPAMPDQMTKVIERKMPDFQCANP